MLFQTNRERTGNHRQEPGALLRPQGYSLRRRRKSI